MIDVSPHIRKIKVVSLRPAPYGSPSGSIILDLFGGSVSTMIACETLHRRARLIELDPAYCDVIVRRWEDFTGRKAVLHVA